MKQLSVSLDNWRENVLFENVREDSMTFIVLIVKKIYSLGHRGKGQEGENLSKVN